MTQSHLRLLVVVLAAAVGAACGEVVPAGKPDGGSTDGGSTDGGARDAGEDDGGAVDAGCGCDAGVCLRGGGCGECELDAHCPSARPACDGASNTCRVCRPAPDSCGPGLYCLNQACVPGCGDATDCQSGVCLPTHDCLNCASDGECAEGRRCGTGTCAAPCTTTCAVGRTCCGGRCVDVARDPGHCGGCDAPCDGGAFCGRGACHRAVLANVCEAPVVTALFDGYDDWSGLTLAQALAASCTPPVTSRSAAQEDAGVLDALTGAPRAPGQLLCVAGGAFHQRVVRWLEQHGYAPVVDSSTPAIFSYSLRDGGVLTQGPVSSITATHDVFVVQISSSASGTPVFNVAGYYSPGTAAGAWYFINVLLPTRAVLTQGWFVVDWVDANVNGSADALDTWTVIGSGP